MTHAMIHAPRLTAIPAAVAALLLAGCSTGHIGDSWQCPLAEGGLCDSVAAADPAVPDPDVAGKAVLAEPLWRVRGRDRAGPTPETAASCETACGAGFDPFAWLARLFVGADPGPAAGAGGEDWPAAEGSGLARADAGTQTVRNPAGSPPVPALTESRLPEPAPAALPAEAGPSQDGPAPDDPHAADLRTGEVVARIWIAPFVDADGVYREASHVRVVLEPAGWRLP